MAIWPAFRMGQYRANDHPYHAPQFIKHKWEPTLVLLTLELYQKYLRMTFEVPFEEVLNFDQQISIQQTK